MLFQLFFKRWPLRRQVSFFQENAVQIGSRKKDNRTIYFYMYSNLFAEVMFEGDDPKGTAQSLTLVKGLKNFNTYLENEFKETSF